MFVRGSATPLASAPVTARPSVCRMCQRENAAEVRTCAGCGHALGSLTLGRDYHRTPAVTGVDPLAPPDVAPE